MKPKDFLEWYRFSRVGGKRMHRNYGLLRKYNPAVFEKLVSKGKFKYQKIEEGDLLQFPVEDECETQ
mgnify:CR=1 FL=1